jgi:predicted glycosyltransferase involved in capsule biosynthesis
MLNDDVKILNSKFFEDVEKNINNELFTINGSWSHFVANRNQMIELGFFDERLLGIGEEDGDFVWRYYQQFRQEIPSLKLRYIDNTGSDLSDDGYKKGIRHYSQFNRDFIMKEKYKKSFIGGYKGMFDHQVKQILVNEKQYPYEEFYLSNKSKL